ncbi:DUF1254 domain-containing protein [Pirellulaceae bacterium SH501]
MIARLSFILVSTLTPIVLFLGPSQHKVHAQAIKSGLTTAEARVIAKEAYIYGFPLVDNYRVLHSYFVNRESPEFKAPWNELHNEARVYTPNDRAIQTPNSDTPYSQLGTDLRGEPLVISVPAVEKGRYYSLQFIDAYTFNYAYVGSRATGTEASSFLLAGPNWKGEKPQGIKAVIRSETELGWVLFRTQLFDPADIDGVKKVQAGYKVQSLSAFLGNPSSPAIVKTDFIKPLTPERQRTSVEFFDLLHFVLRFCPTHPTEKELMARFGKLGLGSGNPFDSARLTPDLKKALEDGMADAWREFAEYKKTQVDTGKRTAADGFGTREYLKNDYLSRMSSAVLGIYGNSKEEALYPIYFTDSEGGKLNASQNRYTLRFPPGSLPPVNAFWSLTMYELPSSLLVDNLLDRYLINSPMLPNLKRDADGGLTLYLQHESPGDGKDANWLPAPDGEFFAVLRLYWPKEDALTGAWKAPPLVRVGDDAARGNAAEVVPVTVENFARAESDVSFEATVKGFDAFGKFHHNREPTKLDEQAVIRMNRDTLYSAAVFDLDAGPVTIALPDAGGRFQSMQVINQDHYTPFVTYGGTHTLTRDAIGTRYVMTIVRTLADASDPDDLASAAKVQDLIRVEQPGGPGTFEVPRWDPASRNRIRDALNVLADTLPDKNHMFGKKSEVDAVRHLLGVSSAWGGNPDKEAIYLNVVPKQNDGKMAHRMTVNKVPVDGFWSVSVYNARGYFEPNSANAYVVNSVTGKKSADGSITIQFGGDPAAAGDGVNVLPITPGWNYIVRLYRPRKEILDGTWRFPEAQLMR